MKTTKEMLETLILQVQHKYAESYQIFADFIEYSKIKGEFKGTEEEFESFMLSNYRENLTKHKSEKQSGHDWYLIYKKGNVVSIHDFYFLKHRKNYERIRNLPDSDFIPYPDKDFLKKAAMLFLKLDNESLYDNRCSRLSYKPTVSALMNAVIATATDTVALL